jgi:hypothetical protein
MGVWFNVENGNNEFIWTSASLLFLQANEKMKKYKHESTFLFSSLALSSIEEKRK